jgi:hypothetical protein
MLIKYRFIVRIFFLYKYTFIIKKCQHNNLQKIYIYIYISTFIDDDNYADDHSCANKNQRSFIVKYAHDNYVT